MSNESLGGATWGSDLKYIKILLAVVIVAEIVVIVRKSFDPIPPPLPVSNLTSLEEPVADAIRAAEKKHKRIVSGSWMALGDLYRSFGLLPEAAYCYEQVDKLDPKETAHLYYWALCHSRMGNLDKSNGLFQRAIDANPKVLQAQYALVRMGQDRLRQGNTESAKEYLRRAVQIGASKIWLCRLLIRQGSIPEAIALLEISINQFKRSIRAHQLLAWAYEKQGDKEKARFHYEMSLRSTAQVPSDEPVRQEDERILGQYGSPALQLQSYMLEQQGKLEEALRLSDQALAITWKEDYALQNAFLLMKSNDPNKAIQVLKQCIDWAGESAETLQLLGDAYDQAKNPTKAIETWENAARLSASRRPLQDISVREKLVRAYREVGGDAELVREHEGFFHFARGKMAFLGGELVDAEKDLQQAVKLIPKEAIAWYYLAESLRHNKLDAKAEKAYEECLKLNPNFGRAIRGLRYLKESRKP